MDAVSTEDARRHSDCACDNPAAAAIFGHIPPLLLTATYNASQLSESLCQDRPLVHHLTVCSYLVPRGCMDKDNRDDFTFAKLSDLKLPVTFRM